VSGASFPDCDHGLSHTSPCSPLSSNQASIGYFSSADVSETIAINQMLVHPGFDPITMSYDFQVVKLASSSSADIIRLNGDPSVPSGELLSVLGIGDTDSGQGFGGDLSVKGGIINLQDNTACAAFKGNSASYSDSIYDSMLCAFGTSTNACQGDNGGPLVAGNINDPSIPDALVGVVSW
jgi:trypsin